MTRETVIEQAREYLALAADLVADYMETHPGESLQGLCKEIDPENWSALRMRVNRSIERRKALQGNDSGRTRDYAKERVGGAAASIKHNPELAEELVEDDEVAAAIVRAASKKLDKKRSDRRRDHGPLKEHKTGLEGAGIAIKCQLIDLELDALIEMVDDTIEGEVAEVLNEYVTTFRMKLDAIDVAMLPEGGGWDDALKEIA